VNTFQKGSQTEAVILAVLATAGYTVLVPFGVARYDLAIDDGRAAGLKTVQCKTGRFRNGCIVWSSCSSHTLTHIKTGYRGQVDYFGVWCPDFDDVYLVPVDEVGEREGWLRVDPARNGRKEENIRWAKDYKVYRLEAKHYGA